MGDENFYTMKHISDKILACKGNKESCEFIDCAFPECLSGISATAIRDSNKQIINYT